MNESKFDLAYCGDERGEATRVKKVFIDKFENGIANETWDEIHGYRLEIDTVDPVDDVEFYSFLVMNRITTLGIGLLERSLSRKVIDSVLAERARVEE